VLAALALGLAGCQRMQPMALGSTQDLALITAFPDSDPRSLAATAVLERPVFSPHAEPRFRVRRFAPEELRLCRDWKCLALLLDASHPGKLDRPLRAALPEAQIAELRKAPAGTRVARDLWARAQAVLILHAGETAAFDSILAAPAPSFLDSYEDGIALALRPALLAAGRDPAMSRHLRRTYGFGLEVPRGYLVGEDPDGRVLRLYRVAEGEPARFLLVHWGPASRRPQGLIDVLEMRDSLVARYYDGDWTLRDSVRGWTGDFQGAPGLRATGVWQNDRYAMGGLFTSVAFVRGDRFYFLDASVFNPPGDKLPFLREVWSLADTFSEAEEP